eukprot:1161295-Pelagomonas_calceolata.AAC.9
MLRAGQRSCLGACTAQANGSGRGASHIGTCTAFVLQAWDREAYVKRQGGASRTVCAPLISRNHGTVTHLLGGRGGASQNGMCTAYIAQPWHSDTFIGRQWRREPERYVHCCLSRNHGTVRHMLGGKGGASQSNEAYVGRQGRSEPERYVHCCLSRNHGTVTHLLGGRGGASQNNEALVGRQGRSEPERHVHCCLSRNHGTVRHMLGGRGGASQSGTLRSLTV